MDTLLQDLRFGVRMLRKKPGFAAIAVLSLALGIGANTTVFSLIHGLLLRPLPFPNPDRIIALYTELPDWGRESVSLPDFADWQQQTQTFESMAAFVSTSGNLGNVENPERLVVGRVTGDLFHVLQVPPVLGRSFTAAEDQPNAAKVAILGYKLWQRRFGGRKDVIGQAIRINTTPYTIVGVAPSHMDLGPSIDLWAPLAVPLDGKTRRSDFLYALGRLKAGIPLSRARAEMSSIASRLAQQYPNTNKDVGIGLLPLHDDLVRNVRSLLLSLWAAVFFVLLIVAANISNLLLARNALQERDLAIRASLGASSTRIVRQLMTESILLATVGGVCGIALAYNAVELLVRFVPGLRMLGTFAIQVPVLMFSLAITLGTGVLFGILPAMHAGRTNLSDTLKESGRVGATTSRHALRRLVIVSEIALSLILLTGAGLMVRTISRLQHVDPGFRSDGLLTFNLTLPPKVYPDGAADQFAAQLINRLESLPEVKSAAAVSSLYLTGSDYLTFVIQGLNDQDDGKTVDAEPRSVTPEFLGTMGIPLLRGRSFTSHDNAQSPNVALVNQRLVRRYFPNQNLIGKYISFGNAADGKPVWREIIGIIGDIHQDSLSSEPYPEIMVPLAQAPTNTLAFVVQAGGDPNNLVGSVRETVKTLDPGVPIYSVQTMQDKMAVSISDRNLQMYVLAGFAVVGLLLSLLGIYGVTAQTVTQRTTEFGIRMALGANPGGILHLVLAQGARLTAAGLALGLAGAFFLSQFMRHFVFGITIHDPSTFVVVALLLSACGMLACYLPARRATKVDPMVALRYE